MPEITAAQQRMMYSDTLEPVREIAREIFPDYDKLDPVKDCRTIFEICFRANTIKYERIGATAQDWRHNTAAPQKPPRFPHLVGKGIMYGNSK